MKCVKGRVRVIRGAEPWARSVPHFPPGVQHLRVTQFGHGQSNPTYKLECLITPNAGGAAATYVLRKKPPGKILASAHAVEREFAVQAALGAASASAVPVPAMVALCEAGSGGCCSPRHPTHPRLFNQMV